MFAWIVPTAVLSRRNFHHISVVSARWNAWGLVEQQLTARTLSSPICLHQWTASDGMLLRSTICSCPISRSIFDIQGRRRGVICKHKHDIIACPPKTRLRDRVPLRFRRRLRRPCPRRATPACWRCTTLPLPLPGRHCLDICGIGVVDDFDELPQLVNVCFCIFPFLLNHPSKICFHFCHPSL